MHPYMFFRNDPAPALRYARAYRKPSKSGEALRRWLRAAFRRWERRKMIAALEAMDDRLLRDIGIYRNDIPRLVDGFDDRELRMRPLATTNAKPEEIYEEVCRNVA
ncbi:DUF1127 domain-containing protein [Sinisalibacter aestuarii]|uniref:YjiS-like domain-containing protein n=1 Tax=Sinisalibacter aestuarii TaxID=2949426 RepID=A0ABQ5LZJ9_9RHOB|nr:DUF1127 domain-containing protein [Sinisalibacter aestuarii]GKY89871.1 hypothetical protein STA1M1_37400 [Sinisalibacter aestuarii]